MGSSLGPILANIFCVVFKVNSWEIVQMISNLYSIDVTLMRYLESFVLLISQINLRSICHVFIEKEKDVYLPFSDVNIFREIENFVTNVYRRKTFSGGLYQIQKFYT